jgi:hypothetical protein
MVVGGIPYLVSASYDCTRTVLRALGLWAVARKCFGAQVKSVCGPQMLRMASGLARISGMGTFDPCPRLCVHQTSTGTCDVGVLCVFSWHGPVLSQSGFCW